MNTRRRAIYNKCRENSNSRYRTGKCYQGDFETDEMQGEEAGEGVGEREGRAVD